MTELEKLNAYCFALIAACRATNADKMELTQEGVTHLGVNVGDWKITIERI